MNNNDKSVPQDILDEFRVKPVEFPVDGGEDDSEDEMSDSILN